MPKTGMMLLGSLLAGSLAACDRDDGDSSRLSAGVAGTWNGTGNYVFNSAPITQFTLNLANPARAMPASRRPADALSTPGLACPSRPLPDRRDGLQLIPPGGRVSAASHRR